MSQVQDSARASLLGSNGSQHVGATSPPMDESSTSGSETGAGGLSDIQVNFLIVGVLFVVVVILAIANLYIERFSRKTRHIHEDGGPVHTMSHSSAGKSNSCGLGGGLGGGSSGRSTRATLLF